MTLSDNDKIIISQLANLSAEKIIEKVMLTHVQTCPHGKKLWQICMILTGAVFGGSLVGGFSVAGIIKLLSL